MSGQAVILEDLIGRFRLKGSDTIGLPPSARGADAPRQFNPPRKASPTPSFNPGTHGKY
jgi:hypothetical protein